MLQWLRFFLQAVLTVAVALIAFHGQQIWYNHGQSWLQAWNIEYTQAGNIMIGALTAIVLIGLLEYFYWRKQDKESNRNGRILEAIARKLKVDESEYDSRKPPTAIDILDSRDRIVPLKSRRRLTMKRKIGIVLIILGIIAALWLLYGAFITQTSTVSGMIVPILLILIGWLLTRKPRVKSGGG